MTPQWQPTPPVHQPCLVFDGHEQFVAWQVGTAWITTGNVEVFPVMYKVLDLPKGDWE